MGTKILTKNQLVRLPVYLELIKKFRKQGILYVNCQSIADELKLNQEQVKKDIAAVASTNGIPNKGRDIEILIKDIEQVLGYDDIHNAILVGVGSLGTALLKYNGFKDYGLKIVAAFDKNPNLVGQKINDIKVYDFSEIRKVFKGLNAKIGIITVPGSNAQEVCDKLVECGVVGIWNFAPVNINVSNKDIIVSHTNIASNLAVLSHQIYLKRKKMQNKLERERLG